MANHNGYIFIAPNGKYVSETHFLSHGNTGPARSFCLTPNLDAAELFPCDELPRNGCDYARVRDGLRDLGFENTQWADDLTAMQARSVQRIEIGDYEE